MSLTCLTRDVVNVITRLCPAPPLSGAYKNFRNCLLMPRSFWCLSPATKIGLSLHDFERRCNEDITDKYLDNMIVDGEGAITEVRLSDLKADGVIIKNLTFKGDKEAKMGSARFTLSSLEHISFIGFSDKSPYQLSYVLFENCSLKNVIFENVTISGRVSLSNSTIDELIIRRGVKLDKLEVKGAKAGTIRLSLTHLENPEEFYAAIGNQRTSGYLLQALESLDPDKADNKILRIELFRQLIGFIKKSSYYSRVISLSPVMQDKLASEAMNSIYQGCEDINSFRKAYLTRVIVV